MFFLLSLLALVAAQTPDDLVYRTMAVSNANPTINSQVALNDLNGSPTAGGWVGHGKFAKEFDVAAAAQESKFQEQLPQELHARRRNSFAQLEEEQSTIRNRYRSADAATKMFDEKKRQTTKDNINGMVAGEHETFVRNAAAYTGAAQARRREALRLQQMKNQYDSETLARAYSLGDTVRGSNFAIGGEIRKQEYRRSLNADQLKALKQDSGTLYNMHRHQSLVLAADSDMTPTERSTIENNLKLMNDVRAPLRGMGGLGWRTKARTELQTARFQKRLEEDQRNMYDPRFADKQASIERNIRRSTDALARINNIKYNEFGEVKRFNSRNQRLSVDGRVIRTPVVKDAAYNTRRTEVLRRRALGREGRAREASAYNTRRTEVLRRRGLGRVGRAAEDASGYASATPRKRAVRR